MAATAVEICNLALDELGVTNKIVALTDQTKEARACNRWYAHTRDLVLRSFPWPFASVSAALVDAGETREGWACAYDLPGDYLKARYIRTPGQRNPRVQVPFLVALNDARTASLLFTDMRDAILEYTPKFATDAAVPLIPAPVTEAIIWKLAAKLVLPLALEAGLAERAEGMFKAVALDAFAVESSDQQFDPPPESEFITVRG